jgi:hypothetical protein
MEKNKYFILPVAVIILFFCTAALCNFCNLPLISGSSQQNENDDKNDNNSGSPSNENNSGNTSNENIYKKAPPTLVLKVYEGPKYSPEDDVTYYRIKAEVTGNPSPQVSFSKDDSKGAWGPLKVQVNLKEGQTYKLNATASNSEGEKTDEILLGWDGVIEEGAQAGQQDDNVLDGDIIDDEEPDVGNDENMEDADGQDDEEMEFAPRNFEILFPDAVTQDSGYFISGQGGKYYYGEDLYIGDTGLSEIASNRQCSGFIVYDISEMRNVFAYDALLEFNLKEKSGDPSFYNNFKVSVFLGDLMIEVFTVPSDNPGSFLLKSDFFTETVNKILASGQDRFEVYCDFMPYASNRNNIWDGWTYEQAGIHLSITQEVN